MDAVSVIYKMLLPGLTQKVAERNLFDIIIAKKKTF